MKKDKIIDFIFVFIGVVSFFAIKYSFAIYRTTALTHGDITTATWSVFLDQTGLNDHLSVVADPNGTTASYTLNITSHSEVDVVYSIVLNGLSDDVSVSADNGTTFTKENNGSVTFTDVGTINYVSGGNTVTKTLIFKALSTAEFVTNNPIDIKVIARQAL